MKLARIVLGFTGVAFAGYGLACLLSPSLPADYAGFELHGPSGATEIAAMYGGLQLAVGILCLRAAANPANVMLGLTVVVTLVGGLAVGRAFGLMMYGPSDYNLAALAYEVLTAVLCVVAIRSIANAPAAVRGS